MINTNQLQTPHPVIPFGMCQVADAAASCGHTVRHLDLCFSRDPQQEIRAAVDAFSPEVIGLSIRNLDNADALAPQSYIGYFQSLVASIRDCSSARIVIGGAAVGVAPDALLQRLEADFAVAGEGERAFPLLLDRLGDTEDVTATCPHPGPLPYAQGATGEGEGAPLLSATGHQLQATGQVLRAPCDLGEFQSVRSGNPLQGLALRRYLRLGSPATIQSKRGCGFRCAYCTYPLIEGSEYRTRDPEAVADEVEMAYSSRMYSSAEFVDSTFNCPHDHALAVCEELARRKNRLPLHTTSINPSQGTLRLFRTMERAGFCGFSASLESASDEVLHRLRKGYTASDMAATVQAARHTSMACMWIFLFGAPGETEATAGETLDFIRKRIGETDLVLISCGLRVYPGTELARIAVEQGVVDPADDLLDPVFYFSPEIGRERLLKKISEADLPKGTILLSDMGWSSLPMLQRIHGLLGLDPPYWRHAKPFLKMRRVFR